MNMQCSPWFASLLCNFCALCTMAISLKTRRELSNIVELAKWQILVDFGGQILHLHCHLCALGPQALVQVFMLACESGQVKHRPDPSKQSGKFSLDAAVLLRSLVGHKLEMQAQAFFHRSGLEGNILSGVVASNLLHDDAFRVVKLSDERNHHFCHLVFGF